MLVLCRASMGRGATPLVFDLVAEPPIPPFLIPRGRTSGLNCASPWTYSERSVAFNPDVPRPDESQ